MVQRERKGKGLSFCGEYWLGAFPTLRDCVCCLPFLRYLGSNISEEDRGSLEILEEKAAGPEVVD